MSADNSLIYMIIASVALGLVGLVLIKKKERHKNLSPVATTAILLNITGIFLNHNETFGYGIISAGLILSIVGIIGKK